MISLVYDDAFDSKERTKLRTGSNIIVYFDGYYYKDFKSLLEKDYLLMNNGGLFFFPPK